MRMTAVFLARKPTQYHIEIDSEPSGPGRGFCRPANPVLKSGITRRYPRETHPGVSHVDTQKLTEALPCIISQQLVVVISKRCMEQSCPGGMVSCDFTAFVRRFVRRHYSK